MHRRFFSTPAPGCRPKAMPQSFAGKRADGWSPRPRPQQSGAHLPESRQHRFCALPGDNLRCPCCSARSLPRGPGNGGRRPTLADRAIAHLETLARQRSKRQNRPCAKLPKELLAAMHVARLNEYAPDQTRLQPRGLAHTNDRRSSARKACYVYPGLDCHMAWF